MSWSYCPQCKCEWNRRTCNHAVHYHPNGKWSHCYTSMKSEPKQHQSKWDEQ